MKTARESEQYEYRTLSKTMIELMFHMTIPAHAQQSSTIILVEYVGEKGFYIIISCGNRFIAN
jgi:hypothetical protein